MKLLSTRFKFSQLLIAFFSLTASTFLCTIICIIIFNRPVFELKDLFVIVVLLLIVLLFRYYFNVFYVTKLYSDYISVTKCFSRKKIYWSGIKYVKLFQDARLPFPVISHYGDSIELTLSSNSKEYIFTDFYSNSDKLRRMIEDKMERVRKGQVEEIVDRGIIDSQYTFSDNEKSVRKFGNRFLNSLYSWVLVLVTVILLLVMFLPSVTPNKVILSSFVLSFYLSIFSFMFYWLELGNNGFRIRNHILPWIKKDYGYGDILEIVFYRDSINNPIGVKIILRDYRIFKYLLDSLKYRDIIKIRKLMHEKDVNTENKIPLFYR